MPLYSKMAVGMWLYMELYGNITAGAGVYTKMHVHAHEHTQCHVHIHVLRTKSPKYNVIGTCIYVVSLVPSSSTSCSMSAVLDGVCNE